ncbi:Arylsulfatase [Andreprevotia sp. IGB-42]|uniref:arylsulfatase n=1 Tax=Andreprevotia sp. IGB-42 TaxID=2497473 RepID=UPI00135C20CB|nr:arylsulfatase [Andreprevotia sp. IGB-42]KAF0813094.1 Arylsulfatase [Andreprevotia sp. IGB-42]
MRIAQAIIAGLTGLALLLPALSMAGPTPLSRKVQTRENMEGSIPRPDQEKAAQAKLDALYQKTGKRPNIIWLVVDDMGFGDVGGPWGGGAHIGAATPNIDQFAREGLALTSTYSQPTCTPTRSAILTGRLPVRTGLTRPILAGDKLKMNPWAGETSIAKILSDAGYYTVLSGKWHVGELEGMRPFDVGFDEYYGYYAAQKEITQSLDERKYPDLVLDPEKLAAYKSMHASSALEYGKKGGQEQIIEPTTSVEQFAEADIKLADWSINKIKTLAKSGKPFFLSHDFMKVHADNFPSKEFKGKSASKYPYKDAVVEVDALIGRIHQAVKEAGIEDNTFIFITSDNGPQMDSWPDTGFTPFRGGKASAWEGGVRVPGIAYWKGMIQPHESAELFDLMDLFNTSIHIAGADARIPTDRFIDGIDQSSFLLADNGNSRRENVYIWVEQDLMAMRMREYKIHFQVTVPEQQWMDIDMSTKQKVGLAPWLFNLYIDPREQTPVGHRGNAWLASMAAEAKAHAATFKKYPPKDVGLGQ